MLLTDDAIEGAKPGGKPYKLSDGRSLYLLISPSGSKLWRLDYRIDGRRRTLALGRYPRISIARARGLTEEARDLLARGIDPGEAKRLARLGRIAAAPKRFLMDSDGSLVVRLPRRTLCLSPEETQDLRAFLTATRGVGGCDADH